MRCLLQRNASPLRGGPLDSVQVARLRRLGRLGLRVQQQHACGFLVERQDAMRDLVPGEERGRRLDLIQGAPKSRLEVMGGQAGPTQFAQRF